MRGGQPPCPSSPAHGTRRGVEGRRDARGVPGGPRGPGGRAGAATFTHHFCEQVLYQAGGSKRSNSKIQKKGGLLPLGAASSRCGAHHHATSESFVSAARSAASTQDGVSADNRTPPGCPAARRGFPRRPPWNNGTSYLRERPLGAPQLVRIRPFSCLHMPTQDRSLVQSRRDRDEFGSELTWTSSS